MLVLSRKTRQQILIGDNITVTILLVKGQVVRVGIEAPRDVRVLRAELPVFDENPRPLLPPRGRPKLNVRRPRPKGSLRPPRRANRACRTERRGHRPACWNCDVVAASLR